MGAARSARGGFFQDAGDVPGNRAEIASLHGPVDVDDWLDIVMRYDGGTWPRRDPGKTPSNCGVFVADEVMGRLTRSDTELIQYCGICTTIG